MAQFTDEDIGKEVLVRLDVLISPKLKLSELEPSSIMPAAEQREVFAVGRLASVGVDYMTVVLRLADGRTLIECVRASRVEPYSDEPDGTREKPYKRIPF